VLKGSSHWSHSEALYTCPRVKIPLPVSMIDPPERKSVSFDVFPSILPLFVVSPPRLYYSTDAFHFPFLFSPLGLTVPSDGREH